MEEVRSFLLIVLLLLLLPVGGLLWFTREVDYRKKKADRIRKILRKYNIEV